MRSGWIWMLTTALLVGGCPTPEMVPDNGMAPDDDAGSPPPVTVRDDDSDSGGTPGTDGGNTGGSTGDNGSGSNDGSDTGGSNDNGNTGGGTNDGNTGGGSTDGGGSDNTGGTPNDGNTGGGDNGDGGTSDPGPAARSGTFSGSVTWQITQGFGGTEFPFSPQVITLDLSFDADGNLVDVFVPGYSSATPDQTVSVLNPGDTTGLPEAEIEFVTVTYTDTTAVIELLVTQNRTAGALMEVGTGEQTISISIDGDNLTFDSTMRYEVQLQGTGPSIDTTETYTASATLTRN